MTPWFHHLCLQICFSTILAFPCGPSFSLPGPRSFLEVLQLLPVTTNWTVSVWTLVLDSYALEATYLSSGGFPFSCPDNTEYLVYQHCYHNLTWGSCGSAADCSNSTIIPNSWTHIAAAYSRPSVKLYLNGSLVLARDFSLTNTSTLRTWFGRRISDIDVFQLVGQLADIRVYHRELLPAEVSQDMARNPPLPGCVFQLDELAHASTFHDSRCNFSIQATNVQSAPSAFAPCQQNRTVQTAGLVCTPEWIAVQSPDIPWTLPANSVCEVQSTISILGNWQLFGQGSVISCRDDAFIRVVGDTLLDSVTFRNCRNRAVLTFGLATVRNSHFINCSVTRYGATRAACQPCADLVQTDGFCGGGALTAGEIQITNSTFTDCFSLGNATGHECGQPGDACVSGHGGALMATDVRLDSVIFKHCTATNMGGAVFAASVTATEVLCRDSRAQFGWGGCFAGYPQSPGSSLFTIERSRFLYNRAESSHGGGIAAVQARMSITDTTFDHCSCGSGRGGAVWSTQKLGLSRSEFLSCAADSPDPSRSLACGGAVALEQAGDGPSTIDCCWFRNCSAALRGGAIYGTGLNHQLIATGCGFDSCQALGNGSVAYQASAGFTALVNWSATDCTLPLTAWGPATPVPSTGDQFESPCGRLLFAISSLPSSDPPVLSLSSFSSPSLALSTPTPSSAIAPSSASSHTQAPGPPSLAVSVQLSGQAIAIHSALSVPLLTCSAAAPCASVDASHGLLLQLTEQDPGCYWYSETTVVPSQIQIDLGAADWSSMQGTRRCLFSTQSLVGTFDLFLVDGSSCADVTVDSEQAGAVTSYYLTFVGSSCSSASKPQALCPS